METLAYLPMDRQQALARGDSIADRVEGVAVFADITGFTPLTEALVAGLGPQRGAEELTHHLNRVYDALLAEVNNYGGSVINFAGDGMTCWFNSDPATGVSGAVHRAATCALAMQDAMGPLSVVDLPSGETLTLAMKVAAAAGPARRFLVGDPAIQLLDTLAGATVDRMSRAEHLARRGEVVLDARCVALLGETVTVGTWRTDPDTGEAFGVVEGLRRAAEPCTWPPLDEGALAEAETRAWLLPAVYERLHSGQGAFLTELRSATALFLSFSGINYDEDEAAGAKLEAYVRWAQGVIAQYDGSLLLVSNGDKGSHLFAAFGAPLAHENDTARAAFAALALHKPGQALDFITETRIGISQGYTRTGAYGSATRASYSVIGDAVNLAARLMQNAAPGQILVGQAAYKSIAGRFVWQSLPPLRVGGKTQPVAVFHLVGSQTRQALRLQEPRYSLPMVGRDAERALLADRLERAEQGRGQLVGITAEAGMGKSRLVAEAIRLGAEHGLETYVGECQSYGTNNSYHVWEPIWRGFFELDPTWPLEEHVDHLARQLAQIDPSLTPRLPLLGVALNLAIPDNELTRSLDAKLRKASLEALLVDCVRARARTAPLLFVLDDCHWLDPLSADLLEALGYAIASLPVWIVIAYRPLEQERRQTLRITQLAHCTEVRLASFTPEEAERLITLKLAQLFGAETPAPPPLVERLTARTEGNPFYLEELLNYIHDLGLNPGDAEAIARLDLPTSLHSLILSRIDRLYESEKTTLKVASIIGRLFRFTWLWGVHPDLGPAARVKADLDALSRLDLTPLDQPEPELTYLFKHNMTQRVAYESLPFATRARLHGQLGHYIEHTYEGSLEQYLDLLAYHYEHSPHEGKKREYLWRAGRAAQAAFANETAIAYYQRLLPLLPSVEQVAVMLELGQVWELIGQWSAAHDLYRQALAQAEQAGDVPAQARCASALAELQRRRGEYGEALAWVEQARAAFERLGDRAGVAQTVKTTGSVALQQGKLAQARSLYEESLATWRAVGDQAVIATLLNNLAVVAMWSSEFAVADALFHEGLALRRALGDKPGVGQILMNLGELNRQRGDLETAEALYQENLAIGRSIGDRWSSATILNNLGILARNRGDYATAQALYQESLAMRTELGDQIGIAQTLNNLGNIHLDQHDYPPARAYLERCLAIRRELGDRRGITNVLIDLGQALADQGDYPSARATYLEALTLSQTLGDRKMLAYLLEAFSGLAALQRQPVRAVQLAGAASAVRAAIGAPLSRQEQARLDRLLGLARRDLGEDQAAAWEAGQAMPLEQAVALAFAESAE